MSKQFEFWSDERAGKMEYAEIPTAKLYARYAVPPSSELVASVREIGVRRPLLVKRDEFGNYLVLHGRRRLAAAMEAGREKVPCLITTVDETTGMALMLVEQHHETQNLVAEITAVRELVETGMGEDDVAGLLHLPVATIRRIASMIDVDREVLKAAEDGKVATTTIASFSKLSRKAKVKALRTLKETGRLTASDVREARMVDTDQEIQGVMGVLDDVLADDASCEDKLREVYWIAVSGEKDALYKIAEVIHKALNGNVGQSKRR